MKKFVEWSSWFILLLAVSILAFVMLNSRRGWEFDAVLSGSMEPVLHVGGLVVMEPIKAQDVKVGDIISFKIAGTDTPVCHRAIGIQSQGGVLSISTKGDANASPDPNPVLADAVKGKEVFFIPYVGYLTYFERFARTQVTVMGRKFSAGFIAVLLMGSTVVGLIVSELFLDISDPWSGRKKQTMDKRRKRLLARRKLMMKVGK